LQPDGKIVAAGTTNLGSGPGDFALARYNSDGSLDTTFNQGLVTTDFGQDEWVTGVALQSDGRIVAAGTTSDDFTNPTPTSSFALARYNPDGSPDSTFGSGGLVT